EPGGAPCPSRNSSRRVGWPGRTGLPTTTTSRRRGLTCLRSAQRAPAAPQDPAIRPVPDAPLALASVPQHPATQPTRATPPTPAPPRAPAIRPTRATWPTRDPWPTPAAPATPLRPLTPLFTPAPTATPVTSATLAHTGSPIRFRTNRCRSGPSGMDSGTTPGRPPRPGPASPAGGRCGRRPAGGGGAATWAGAGPGGEGGGS